MPSFAKTARPRFAAALAPIALAAALFLTPATAQAFEGIEPEDPGAREAMAPARVMDRAAPAPQAEDAATPGDDPVKGDDATDRTDPDGDGVFVIALDPGHGGRDPGACANGLQEKDLNWKIALACKAELEQAYEVRVVLTRTEGECPSLYDRVERALDAGADVFVSLHTNSAVSTATSGAEVYHPNNATFHQELYARGRGLSQSILKRLSSEVGLVNRGPKIRNTEAGGTYPDGSASDYYSVIYYARKAGVLGIIVEHAFITSPSDVLLLANDGTLARMGQADARGIADYYGLKMTPGWKVENGKWKHHDGTSFAVGGWRQVDGLWYLFDGSGYMLTGWQQLGGTWYYLQPSGAMAKGWFNDRGTWYWLDKQTGAMATGWVLDGTTWYWCDASGAMRSNGWLNTGGRWYWLEPSGAMRTGWLRTGGSWYWLDRDSGAMATGWARDGSHWYWLEASGAMRGEGWLAAGGKWYWLQGSGAMAEGWLNRGGTWYYLTPGSGAMAEGWAEVGGARYYLTPGSGAMHVGWLRLDGGWYYLEASGAAARGMRTIDGVAYRFDSKGLWADDPDLPADLRPAELTAIMGEGDATAAQMAALYRKKATAGGFAYPAEALGKGGAPDIDAFCSIVTEEARAEGVRADVVFAQMMNETGWLRFGGDVKVEQFNFAGLGATGGGVPGNSFADVRQGARAQVQHLKAYASTEPLRQECVDSRFGYVTRGCAPYVEWLGIPDNPDGKGWAATAGYGARLLAIMAELG